MNQHIMVNDCTDSCPCAVRVFFSSLLSCDSYAQYRTTLHTLEISILDPKHHVAQNIRDANDVLATAGIGVIVHCILH